MKKDLCPNFVQLGQFDKLTKYGFDVTNKEQMDTLSDILDGHNVVFFGKAGSGKSTFTKNLYRLLESEDDRLTILAPTGMAVNNFTADGVPASTIHSYLRLNPNGRDGKLSDDTVEALRHVKRILLDESSMISSLLMDRFHQRLKSPEGLFGMGDTWRLTSDFKRWSEDDFKFFAESLFGGIQIIITGDMSQLPPVVKRESHHNLNQITHKTYREMQYASEFWFDAHCLGYGGLQSFKYHSFLKNYRQGGDLKFAESLDRVRLGKQTSADMRYLNESVLDSKFSEEKIIEALVKKDAVYLAGVNKQVKAINDKCYAWLKADGNIFHTAKAIITSAWFEDKLDYPVPRELTLCEGMKVMCLYNNREKDVINGYITRITGINIYTEKDKKIYYDNEGNPQIKNITLINLANKAVKLGYHTWFVMTIEESNLFEEWKSNQTTPFGQSDMMKWIHQNVARRFTQIYAKPAFALSIHKSQGITIDKGFVDPSRFFAAGQCYVALSRVRSKKGLFLKSKLLPKHIKVSKTVIDFYEENQLKL